MKKVAKILSPSTLIGTVLAGLAVYAVIILIERLRGTKRETSKIYGFVLEKKQYLTPVYNASVNFLNIREERTDSNGRFSTQLKGNGKDSITIEITLPAGQKFNQKFLVDYQKKEIFLDPLVFPTNEGTRINEVSKEEFIQTQKNKPLPTSLDTSIEQNSQAPSPEIKKLKPTEQPTNSEKADFGVIVTTNGKKDSRLANSFVEWLKANGTVSQSILQNLFIEQVYFDQVLNGNSLAIKKANVSQSVKHICLVRATITYSSSKIDESLVVANNVYEVVVIETATGRTVDSFEHTEKSSGISEEMAKKRAEDDFIKYLNKRTFSL